MKVTKVELSFPNRVGPKFKCWAHVVFDDILYVSGIRLFEHRRRDGTLVEQYIRFPDRQPSLHSTGGTFVSIAIVNTDDEDLRKHITDSVFEAYDKHPKNPMNWKNKEKQPE